ncbi:ATP-binding protein [Micromonospora sp. NPDC048935]|uniref:ATP-binding protein n=1 Tax=Micromonospora sp. NPDC048935 TaxID=3364262 RepID=UPI003713D128
MSSCLVTIDDSSAVVRLTGTLDAAGAESVRAALLACLWDRPGQVVADVTGLRVSEPRAWDVFAEVRREVADWPAGDLLLCDPSADRPDQASTALAGGSARSITTAGVPAWPTLDGALAAVAAVPLAGMLSTPLAATVVAAREARELVTTGCRTWGMPTLTDPAGIAITEMVNNVVAHARTSMTVRLAARDGALHLAVRDYSSRRPTFAGLSPPTRVGGRGLLLIDTVARRWGSSALPDGKVVWCVLHPDDEAGAFD